MPARFLGDLLLGSRRVRSSDFPPGSPISPVAPPASTIGRWPASWRRRRLQSWRRLPTCRLSAVGSKPAVGGERVAFEPAQRARRRSSGGRGHGTGGLRRGSPSPQPATRAPRGRALPSGSSARPGGMPGRKGPCQTRTCHGTSRRCSRSGPSTISPDVRRRSLRTSWAHCSATDRTRSSCPRTKTTTTGSGATAWSMRSHLADGGVAGYRNRWVRTHALAASGDPASPKDPAEPIDGRRPTPTSSASPAGARARRVRLPPRPLPRPRASPYRGLRRPAGAPR